MTTREALLKAVLAAPDDDLPRLVFADFLEENGEAERAELIRVQCELAKVPVKTFGPTEGRGQLQCDNLRRRERELWKSIDKKQFVPWHDGLIVYSSAALAVGGFRLGERGPQLITRRGFVAEVFCSLAKWYETCLGCGGYGGAHASEECRSDFTGIGTAVVREHPVVKVVLEDKQPYRDDSDPEVWSWDVIPGDGWRILPDDMTDGDRNTLPGAIGYHLAGTPCADAGYWRFDFETRELALSALSDACLKWAKSQPEVATPDAGSG